MALGSFAGYYRKLSVEKLELYMTLSIKKQIFKELLNKNMLFFNKSHSARLSLILTKDIRDFCSVITMQAAIFIKGLIYCIVSSCLLLINNFTLLIIGSFPLCLMIFTGRKVATTLRKKQFEVTASKGKLNVYTSEVFRLIKPVKLFSAEDLEVSRYSSYINDINKKSTELAYYYSTFFSIIELIIEGIVICGLGLGLYIRNYYPDIHLEDYSSTGFYVIVGGIGFRQILSSYAEMQKALGLLEEIKRIYQDPSRESHQLESPPANTFLPHIVIKNLHFSYNDEEILHGINLEFLPGQITGIIGESGNGKTTLVNMVNCLYRPTSGQITINGVNIFDHQPSWTRQQLGVVSQEGLLFTGSILDNIKYTCGDVDQEVMFEVCEQVGIFEFIKSLPNGFDTQVGENGLSLSGGQRQRINIARALMKQPKILVLDEATSGLDSLAERNIQKVIESAAKSRKYTVLIVTHRVSSLQGLADKIYWISKGEVRTEGTYENLLEDPEFRILVKI